MSPSVEPFNEAKYKALMDGLECKEIYKSKLERTLRIDAEFYSKVFIDISEKLSTYDHGSLTDCVKVSDGNHMGISDHFCEVGIPYYRGQDAGSFFIENSKPICIDKEVFEMPVMRRSHLKQGDVLLSIVGTIGALSLVYDNKKATCSCKLAILRPKSGNSSELLATFLRSRYGQYQIARFTRGAIQKGLILEDMDQILIPDFGELFVETIEKIVQDSHRLQENASAAYDSAEEILQAQISVDVTAAKSISQKSVLESFGRFGRLDAEYYQPKFDVLLETLKQFPCKPLGGCQGLVSIKKSIEPGSEVYQDDGIPFVRVSDINKFEISDPEIHLPINIVQDIYKLYPKKDTILLSKDGSVGIAYKLEEDSALITSGALLHLTVKNTKEVLPDYLTLILNSNVVKLQAERDTNGAIIQHWKPSDIEKVIIPILDMDTQQKISAKVQSSFSLRRKSKEYLEYAKQAVEMAIEQGEDEALNWLKDKVK